MDSVHLRHAVLSIGEVKRSIGDWQVQIGAKKGTLNILLKIPIGPCASTFAIIC